MNASQRASCSTRDPFVRLVRLRDMARAANDRGNRGVVEQVASVPNETLPCSSVPPQALPSAAMSDSPCVSKPGDADSKSNSM